MMGPKIEGYTPTSQDDAREICRVLSIERGSTGLLSRPGYILPFSVEFSDTGYVRSLAGAQMAPAQFMLDALRFHFSREYDAHQHKRERSMQRAMARLLDEDFSGLECHVASVCECCRADEEASGHNHNIVGTFSDAPGVRKPSVRQSSQAHPV